MTDIIYEEAVLLSNFVSLNLWHGWNWHQMQITYVEILGIEPNVTNQAMHYIVHLRNALHNFSCIFSYSLKFCQDLGRKIVCWIVNGESSAANDFIRKHLASFSSSYYTTITSSPVICWLGCRLLTWIKISFDL